MSDGAIAAGGLVASRVLAHAASDRVAIVDDAGAVSFATLAARAGRVATRLGGSHGLRGERVAILAAPDADWVAALLGIWLAGGVAVPLSAQYPAAELAWFCDDAGATRAIVSPSWRALATPLSVGRTLLEPAALAAPGVAVSSGTVPAATEVALLVYTSGTTGKPKGAMLTHDGVAVQTSILAEAWGSTADDRLLHALPLHHVHGLVVALLTALAAGASVHLLSRFDPEAVVASLPSATVWMAVPTMYQKLRGLDHATVRRAASQLRLATSGSAALPVAVASWWAELTGAIPLERYGMTETGIVLSNPLAAAERQRGRVGRALPTFDVRLVGDDDQPTATGPGELQVRGPSLFAGYWNRPDATAAAYTTDGWFRTGDRAECDAAGSIRLLGRASTDILKSGGYKISALEIEDVLRDHPDVSDVAVVGVPDELWGDRVVAVVVGARAIDADALRAWARERLAAYQVPKEVVRVDDLPRNPLGKCLKPELIAQLVARAPRG